MGTIDLSWIARLLNVESCDRKSLHLRVVMTGLWSDVTPSAFHDVSAVSDVYQTAGAELIR